MEGGREGCSFISFFLPFFFFAPGHVSFSPPFPRLRMPQIDRLFFFSRVYLLVALLSPFNVGLAERGEGKEEKRKERDDTLTQSAAIVAVLPEREKKVLG